MCESAVGSMCMVGFWQWMQASGWKISIPSTCSVGNIQQRISSQEQLQGVSFLQWWCSLQYSEITVLLLTDVSLSWSAMFCWDWQTIQMWGQGCSASPTTHEAVQGCHQPWASSANRTCFASVDCSWLMRGRMPMAYMAMAKAISLCCPLTWENLHYDNAYSQALEGKSTEIQLGVKPGTCEYYSQMLLLDPQQRSRSKLGTRLEGKPCNSYSTIKMFALATLPYILITSVAILLCSWEVSFC